MGAVSFVNSSTLRLVVSPTSKMWTGGLVLMKVRKEEGRIVFDDTASFIMDCLTGDSALPRCGIHFPAAVRGGNFQEGKSCGLNCCDIVEEKIWLEEPSEDEVGALAAFE